MTNPPARPDRSPDRDSPEPPSQELRRLEAAMASLRTDLDGERARAAQLSRELEAARGELEEIRASTAWRAALAYYRVRDGFPLLRVAHRLARKFKARLSRGALALGAPARLRHSEWRDLRGLTLGKRGRVSVVLPVYNHASMLTGAIESVLAQTHRDLELIVVNDGSTDGAEPVLDRFADDPRVVVLTQPNQQLPSALNNGFQVATGEYFTWTSADNLMLPHQLEVLVRHLDAHPEQAMVYSDYQAIDADGRPLEDEGFRPQNRNRREPGRVRLPTEVTVTNLHVDGDNFIGASFLYRRDAARIVGRFSEDAFGAEDYDYWLRLHALFAIGHVPEVLYQYRVHANTLQARARELRIAGNVRRVRERDAARLQFLASAPRWLHLGVDVPGTAAWDGRDAPDVVVFPSSSARREEVRAALRAGTLAIAVVDQPLDAVEEEALSRADLLLAREPAVQAHLEKAFGDRVLMLDPARDSGLLERIARYRLFEKRNVEPTRLPGARVHPVREPLAVGIQVDGLDRGGLEQIVCDLVRALDPGRVRATVLVHAREPGQGGRALREAGVDVAVTGGDEKRLVATVDERRLRVVNLHHSIAGTATYAAHGLATVYTVHSSYAWMKGLDRAVRSAALQSVDLFLVVSRQVERFFEATMGIDPRRVRVVPNGLDPRELEDVPAADRAALGISPSEYVFLQVGSIYPAKLQAVTVRAFQRLAREVPSARLLLVGNVLEPEYGREVERACADDVARGRVRLMPWCSRREVAALMRASDCFVLPSLVEGWSIALMEAMYFGLPLVVTDVGSAREVIRNGDIGIVLPNPYERLCTMRSSELSALARRYPDRNLEALVAAMRDMVERRDEWRARARAGTERVRSEFDIHTMARAYECAFEDAWRRARKPAKATRNTATAAAGTGET